MRGMTTREKAHKLLDELPESEIEPVVEILVSRVDNGTSDEPGEDEPDVVGLPESWKTFENGTPQPNWVAAVRRARDGH
jgi:hypothetical protein